MQCSEATLSAEGQLTAIKFKLCFLQERPASREADSTCIVMCRLEKGQAGRWTVQAVGEYLSYGCTMIYGPIFEHVEQHRRSLQAA